MSEPNEISKRVARLEYEVTEARKDAAAARVLAGGADRDVSTMQATLRAHTASLNALRETQLEQGTRLGSLERKVDDGFARIDERFARVDDRLARFDEGFTKLSLGQAQITALLTAHLDKPAEEG